MKVYHLDTKTFSANKN